MKAPDKIYLTSLFVKACGEILSERAKEDDVEYIREDLIKAEIERLIGEHKDWSSFYHSRGKHSDFEKGAIFALNRMLHFIDNLFGGKSARQRLAEWSQTPEGRESYEKVAEEMRREVALDDEIKNYFKEWVDEDTDSVHNGCAINDSNQYVSLCDCARIARHFAQWGAEHLKK